MLALDLLGFVLTVVALFALGVWYAAVLAADLSRVTILLMAIVPKITRIKFAAREATRPSDDT
jgi:energy-converting hydrogenase Eha subunit C